MPDFATEEEDVRDTLMVGRNADAKLFENVEEMIRLEEVMKSGALTGSILDSARS